MRPQDIVILLKILCLKSTQWYSKDLAAALYLSTSEVSGSLARSAISGLIDTDKKKIRVQALLEFLNYGLPYVFPQHPGNISRGIPTAHSHPYMQQQFATETLYVWPNANSTTRGVSIQPLYPGAVKAALHDEELYLMLALVDVLRVGKVREKKVAFAKLKKLMS